jgi:hypothetical protein
MQAIIPHLCGKLYKKPHSIPKNAVLRNTARRDILHKTPLFARVSARTGGRAALRLLPCHTQSGAYFRAHGGGCAAPSYKKKRESFFWENLLSLYDD